jgi:hypothetical protein
MDDTERRFIYILDKQGIITDINEDWLAFARENEAEELSLERVLGKHLLDFTEGAQVRYLYQLMLDEVLLRQQALVFPFRCDSPDMRRYMEAEVSCTDNEHIRFCNHIVRCEQRETLNILERDIERSDKIVVMCSYCNKFRSEEGHWLEPEVLLTTRHFMELSAPPGISHGVCKPCFDLAMAQIGR